MSIFGKTVQKAPTWTLGEKTIENVNELEILGNVFSNNLSSEPHVKKRTKACRVSMYSLTEIGCCYPGLSSDVKIHLWKTIGQPTLLYGLESMSISHNSLKSIESCQGSFVKKMLGFSNRSHHSNLLEAAHINKVENMITKNSISLWRKSFSCLSPLRYVCAYNLANFMLNSKLTDGTLVDRLVSKGLSPISLLFDDRKYIVNQSENENGIVDSLRYLIMSESLIKPYSDEHILATLLVKAF